MELEDFVGKHLFSGVDYAETSEKEGIGLNVLFCIDGVTYLAEEDEDDGYRSYMKELVVSEVPPKNTFSPEEVVCEHSEKHESHNGECDILFINNAKTGELILKIGTEDTDDYYPYCVMEYYPENMQCNKGGRQ